MPLKKVQAIQDAAWHHELIKSTLGQDEGKSKNMGNFEKFAKTRVFIK